MNVSQKKYAVGRVRNEANRLFLLKRASLLPPSLKSLSYNDIADLLEAGILKMADRAEMVAKLRTIGTSILACIINYDQFLNERNAAWTKGYEAAIEQLAEYKKKLDAETVKFEDNVMLGGSVVDFEAFIDKMSKIK